MTLKRCGSNRYSGYTNLIKAKPFSVSWKKQEEVLELTVQRVPGAQNSEYDFTFTFSLAELGKLLDFVSNDVLRDSSTLAAKRLKPSSRALLRLLIASGGIATAPPVEARD